MIPQLTAVRGPLAVWVVLFHFVGRPFAPESLGPLDAVVSRGYLGVDSFFLLSGLIIAHSWRVGARRSWAAFIRARLARIYPAHLAVLALFGIALAATGGDLVGRYGAPGLLYSLLLVDAWGVIDDLTWNYPSWSISAEWFAYLLAPLVLPRLLDAPRRAFIPLAAVAVAVLAVADTGLVSGLAAWTDGRALARIAGEFTCGVGIARLVRPGSARSPVWLGVGGGVLVLGIAIGLDVVAITGITIVLAALYAWPPMALPAWTIALGQRSYAIYLIHALVQVIAEAVVADVALQPAERAVGLAVAVVVVLLAGAALHRFVEEPCRRRWAVARPVGPSRAVPPAVGGPPVAGGPPVFNAPEPLQSLRR